MFDARNGIHAGLTAILAWLALSIGLLDHVFMKNPAFSYMAAVASERSWSLFFWIVANLGLFGLATRNRALKLVSVLLVATAHGIFAGCLLVSDAGIGAGTYSIIACMGYYLAYRGARAGI